MREFFIGLPGSKKAWFVFLLSLFRHKRRIPARDVGVMITLSINLPFAKRLHLRLVSRRKNPRQSIFPKLEEVLHVRKGSKISRFFRHVFEHLNIRKLVGANIALMVITTNLIPTQINAFDETNQEETATVESLAVLPIEKIVRFPVEKVAITQNFRLFHPGVDFDGLTGDAIYPITNGRVEAIDESKYAYGKAIYINHGSGLTSLYAHLSKILVKVNDEVTTNTKIGEMGATGNAHGDHLHLEIRNEGIPINPLAILPK